MSTPTDAPTFIEWLHQIYVKDKNPLHVWEAYRGLSRPPRPLPDWVATYLNECADALLAGVPAEDALKLATKGGASKHRQLVRRHRDIWIFSILDARMQATRDTLPRDADLTPAQRALVNRRFAPLLRGETRLDRLCEELAEETRQPGNRITDDLQGLSAKRLRDIYLNEKNLK